MVAGACAWYCPNSPNLSVICVLRYASQLSHLRAMEPKGRSSGLTRWGWIVLHAIVISMPVGITMTSSPLDDREDQTCGMCRVMEDAVDRRLVFTCGFARSPRLCCCCR